jgi:hypothetical protein
MLGSCFTFSLDDGFPLRLTSSIVHLTGYGWWDAFQMSTFDAIAC